MGLPLTALYAVVERSLPEALVEPAALASLADILGSIPACADTFGFEARLRGLDPAVDVGIGITTASDAPRFLAARDGDANLARAVQVDDCWRRIRTFARRWTDPASSWLVLVPFLFLEFDSDGPRTPVRVPSVFVGLDWPFNELSPEARRQGR